MRIRLIILSFLILSTFTAIAQEESSLFNRCINLGNMLEAPVEGEWGLRVQEFYMETISDAGFDAVRIPIRWSAHADESAPYEIDDEFFDRIHQIVEWALDADLQVILNVHHYEEMMTHPEEHFERLDALWMQIATSFADYPETVYFELLNEPNNALDNSLWNELYPQLITTIRETNPERQIIVGGDNWNSADSLDGLELPDDTENLIATFHFYLPFQFTHQGAEWAEGSSAWLGIEFGSEDDFELVETTFDDVAAWSEEHDIPVLLGEFGAYSRADMESRLLYTETVREAAESRDFAWCYWEFASGFGIYDVGSRTFNDLYPMLIPEIEE